MLQNVQYTRGDSFDVLMDNVQKSWEFLTDLEVLGGPNSSQFATALSASQETSVTVIATKTGTIYKLTFRRIPGNTGVDVDYRVAGNGTDQANTTPGESATASNHQMSGARADHNEASTGADQKNLAAGNGTSASNNQARDEGTKQSNQAYAGGRCIFL